MTLTEGWERFKDGGVIERGTGLLRVKKQGLDTPGREHSRDKDTEEEQGQATQGKQQIFRAEAGNTGMATLGRNLELCAEEMARTKIVESPGRMPVQQRRA